MREGRVNKKIRVNASDEGMVPVRLRHWSGVFA
jgi:hypothetical protein